MFKELGGIMQIPHAAGGQICPLHKQDTSEVCHKCPWFTRIMGKNPQSEEMVDNWHCAIALIPLLLVDNTQVNRGTVAAVETMRNDIVQGAMDAIAIGMGTPRLIGRH
jgi:hypothetical protein